MRSILDWGSAPWATALPDGVSEADALDYLDKKVSSDLVHIF